MCSKLDHEYEKSGAREEKNQPKGRSYQWQQICCKLTWFEVQYVSIISE